MLNKIQKQPLLKYFLIFIIAVSIIMRCVQFGDWMLLKGDQIRDLKVTDRVIDGGIGDLPLLGPRAGGTMLRLGPAFYYFQSFSALLAGENSPVSAAMPNLIFSIASIFLAYLLLKKYFSQNWSLALTAFYASGFLAIEYSRFTWNPNSIPFFVMLFIYSLLQVYSPETGKKILWSALAGFSFAIAGQLHFTSFIALPIFLIAFLIAEHKYTFKHIRLSYVITFLGVILVCYIPVILSDILNKGDNFFLFFKSIGTKKSDHSLLANIGTDIYYFGQYFFRILTGYFGSLKILHYLGILFVFAGFTVNWLALRKEENSERKKFLFAIFLWILVLFVLYIPLAYDIDKPRFYLPVLIIPAIWLGLLCQSLRKWDVAKKSFVALVAILICSNLVAASLWLGEISKSQRAALDPGNSIILKTKKDAAWWTWGIVSKAAVFMQQSCDRQKISYYLPKKVAEFGDVFDWAMVANGGKKPVSMLKKIPNEFGEGCYFLVEKTSQKDYMNLQIEKEAVFGDITVARIKTGVLAGPEITPEAAETDLPETQDNGGSSDHQRAYWKDVIELFSN